MKKQEQLAELRSEAIAYTKAAIRQAKKRDIRDAIESVMRYGSVKQRTITMRWADEYVGKKHVEYLQITYHCYSGDAYSNAVRFSKNEALKLLGFTWRKLGL